MTRSICISAEILDVLRTVDFDGQNARLVGQLDRQIYLAVNKVLEALGGQWNRTLRAHAFADGDPRELIGDAVTTGGYIDPKQQMQFFPTPPALAAELVRRAGVEPGMRALEPSAGDGAIVRALRHAGVSRIMTCDIDPKHAVRLSLEEGACPHIVGDFLAVNPAHYEPFDAVVMNPPFSRSQDIRHVRHAYDFLRPGGRLAAIMGSGWTFRQDRVATEFRAWLDDLPASVVPNAADAFRESGTMVSTVTVDLEKEAA